MAQTNCHSSFFACNSAAEASLEKRLGSADVLSAVLNAGRFIKMSEAEQKRLLAQVVDAGKVDMPEEIGNALRAMNEEQPRLTCVADIEAAHNRVGSDHKELGYLEVPSLPLDSSYEIEISEAELEDPGRFLEACRRRGITHLFGDAGSFPELREHLRVIYRNPSSHLGGIRFFREPPTEATAVFEIVYPK